MSDNYTGMHWECPECHKPVYRHYEYCNYCLKGLAPWASPEMKSKILSEEARPDLIPGTADG